MFFSTRALLACGLSTSLLFAACADDAASAGSGGSGMGPGAGPGTGAGGADATPSGLPCDVAAVLTSKCTSCHSNPPRSSAPQPLITREDLLAASVVDPTMSYAQRSLLRMRAGTMPANGGAEADADVIDAWLAAGAPEGECGAGGGAADPFDTPSECVGGKTWPLNGEEGPNMNPGQACNKCHAEELANGELDAKVFVAAGTAYPNGHSPDNCYGVNGSAAPYQGVKVVLTDAVGAAYTMDVRTTGNFYLEEAENFVPPYTAKIVDTNTGAERPMVEAQTEGDCNLCHTEMGLGDGSEAPGRILVP